MEFDVNSPWLFVIVAIIIAFVLAQSVFFLVRAIKRAKEKGMDKKVISSTIKKAVLFTIAPAISIFIGVITLSFSLGLPLPWLRLSVIGSLTYETTAADAALKAIGSSLGEAVTAEQFVTVATVMMLGIIMGLILVPALCKKVDTGMIKFQQKDKKWGDIFQTALFMGMISAFLGFIFCDVTTGLSGWIPVVIMLISALLMVICGALMKLLNWKWLNDYALPICMVVSMALAIPITGLMG
jgi:heme/copper-type cytochrome/quinol oxidase subunit 2